jgi:hypothetical protein
MLRGEDYKDSDGTNQSEPRILYTRLVGLEAGTYVRSRCWRTAWVAWGVEDKAPRDPHVEFALRTVNGHQTADQ